MGLDYNTTAAAQVTVGPLVDYADLLVWVAWQTEQPKTRPKPTKVPYSPRRDGRAKSDDPATWGSLDQAVQRAAALAKPLGQGGVGVMLAALATGDHLGGIDLDSCRDPESGDIEPWAREIIARIDSYTEVSPSGTGFKVFFLYDPAAVAAHDLQNKTFTRGKLSAGSIVHWARESDDTWNPSSHATNLPVVRITGGELPRMVDEAEAALLAMNSDLYQQGPRLVRPVWDEITTAKGKAKALRLSPVQAAHLHERFTEAAYFEKAKWTRGGGWEFSRVDCPDRIVDAYMGRDGMWKLPKLRGVVTAPTLRPDGSILDQPGYDEATGILFDPCGVVFPSVPQYPGRDDALRALAVLKAPFRDVPFVSKQDLAVALSGVLTTVTRRALPVAPMHAYTAPTAGSGKSNLVDVASMIASGGPAAVTSMGGSGRGIGGESELEKRLHASYLAGAQIITIDNIESPLGGDFLCQAASQHIVEVRVLGHSTNIKIPNTVALFATGNNLVIIGDLTRRVLLGSIDAMVERPELRHFEWDLVDYAMDHRAELVVAALTIIRARVVSGDQRPKPLGGYREWSHLVRDALVWLGEADPVDTMERIRAGDPQLDKLKMIIDALRTVFGQREVTVREMINASTEPWEENGRELRDALLLAAANVRGEVNAEKLSWWLRHNVDRPVKLDADAREAFRIVKIKGSKYARWMIEAVLQQEEEAVQGEEEEEEEWQS